MDGNIITLPNWGELIFVLLLNFMKWPRLQEADLSQCEKQIEVVVKGPPLNHQIFKWDYICDQVMHIDKMYNFQGLGVPLNCALIQMTA